MLIVQVYRLVFSLNPCRSIMLAGRTLLTPRLMAYLVLKKRLKTPIELRAWKPLGIGPILSSFIMDEGRLCYYGSGRDIGPKKDPYAGGAGLGLSGTKVP
jgi:hypothetical protein